MLLIPYFVRVCTKDWLQFGTSLHGSNNYRTFIYYSKMMYCSFGNSSDPCSAVKWAQHDDAIISLMSCTSDMGPWLKNKHKGSGASGMRGRPKAGKTNTTSE